MKLKSLPLFIVGVILIVVAVTILYKAIIILKDGIKTKGIIAGIDYYPNEERQRSYSVGYKVDEIKYTVHHNIATRSIKTKDIGKEIGIIYSKKQPKKIIVLQDYNFYLFAFFMGILGIWLINEGVKILSS